jgi:hypothetical protein
VHAPGSRLWILLVTAIRRVVKRRPAMWVAAILVLGACRDGKNPTGPSAVQPVVTVTNAPGLADMLADAEERIVPNMPAAPARETMADAFRALSGALAKGPASLVSVALTNANSAIDSYGSVLKGNDGALADLDALRLAMNAIDTQLIADSRTGS